MTHLPREASKDRFRSDANQPPAMLGVRPQTPQDESGT